MKILGNPWVVGALCVAAAGVVGYQFLPARPHPAPAPAPSGAAPVPAAVAGALAPGTPAGRAADSARAATGFKPGTSVPASASRIDRSYVQAHLGEWVESPQRDPFLLTVTPTRAVAEVSPLSKWRLNAVWQQTGSSLATINNGVYAEGEVIDGYTLETIERDRVWLRGPAGRESLSFTNLAPPAVAPADTNAPAVK